MTAIPSGDSPVAHYSATINSRAPAMHHLRRLQQPLSVPYLCGSPVRVQPVRPPLLDAKTVCHSSLLADPRQSCHSDGVAGVGEPAGEGFGSPRSLPSSRNLARFSRSPRSPVPGA